MQGDTVNLDAFFHLLFLFQGGIYLFQLVDWYIAILAVPIFGFIECIIFGWIYGKYSNK